MMVTLRGALCAMAASVAVALAVAPVAGCGKDKGQQSAELARPNVERLVALTDEDVAEVERGLPEGAKRLRALLGDDLDAAEGRRPSPPAVRTALLKMRQQVPDLGIAKSTFFALANERGVALRNDFEQDTMAGKDLVAGWPGLAPVVGGAAFASTTGQFPGAPNPAGPDKEWVAAVPVKSGDAVQGLLVTGWTYRRFAYHLQVTLQREVQDEITRGEGKSKMPILYVCLFDEEHVYGAGAPGAVPVPAVNEQALGRIGLHGQTAAGMAAAAIRITERDFGWAAARLPRLGPNVGVVVLRSEI